MTRPRDRLGRPLPEGSPDQLQAGPPPRSIAQALQRGVELFARERFFEAHECFEWAWKAPEADDADRRFWKGLAQVAVGCCHVQRGNAVGAVALLERGVGYLRGYPSPHHGIDTEMLRAGSLALARRITPEPEFPRLSFQNS